MSTPHPQAEILRAIADGKTIQRFYPIRGGIWVDSVTPLSDVIQNERIRIKPDTVNINSHKVPCPVMEPLNYREEYYIPNERDDPLYTKLTWLDDHIDKRLLARGLIHCRKEAAIAHAEALLSFTFTRSDK